METLLETPEISKLTATLPLIKTLEKLEDEDNPGIILTHLVKSLRDLRRLPKWDSETKENNAEHSYMVSLFVSHYKNEFYFDDQEIDDTLIKEYAEVHDWVELLVGDTVTLGMDELKYVEKQQLEEVALIILVDFLHRKDLDRLADLLEDYEGQRNKSARFVKAVDKLMPHLVKIAGDCVQPIIDHHINDAESLKQAHTVDRQRFTDRFGEEFPELLVEYIKYQTQADELFERAVDEEYLQDGKLVKGLGHYSI